MPQPSKNAFVTENHDGKRSAEDKRSGEPASLNGFIEERVSPLAQMFAQTPLMSLRVETQHGAVTFEKAARTDRTTVFDVGRPAGARTLTSPALGPRHHRQRHDGIMPEPELGEPYDTINADIVGVFHPAPDMPMPGALVEDGQLLGFIEALKLQNPVLNARRGTFVAQIAEDGQAVDFGEALFVIDHGEAKRAEIASTVDENRPLLAPAAAEASPEEEAQPLEPPRL